MALKHIRALDSQQTKEKMMEIRGEIFLHSRLKHSNIVHFLGHHVNDHGLFIALEYVDWGSLHGHIEYYYKERTENKVCS